MHVTLPPASTQACQALNKRGEPCRAGARAGQVYCFQHDPERAEAVAEARRKGGANSKKPASAPPVDLSTPERCRLAVEETINRLRRGDESVQVARTVLYAVAVTRPVLELEGITERIAALEARIGEKV